MCLLPTLANGEVTTNSTYWNPKYILPFDAVYFTCDGGWILNGTNSSNCKSGNNTVPDIPTCDPGKDQFILTKDTAWSCSTNVVIYRYPMYICASNLLN